jgi:fucose 4-O-acetylase-like acetyltransferase
VASTTIVFGTLMILLGVVGYFVTGRQSPTALIPAIPGLLFVILGALARNPRLRMHAMHAVAALALIGFLAMIPGLIKLMRWAGGTAPGRPAAVVSQSVLAGLLLVFLVLCVRSFVAARRQRAAGIAGEVR